MCSSLTCFLLQDTTHAHAHTRTHTRISDLDSILLCCWLCCSGCWACCACWACRACCAFKRVFLVTSFSIKCFFWLASTPVIAWMARIRVACAVWQCKGKQHQHKIELQASTIPVITLPGVAVYWMNLGKLFTENSMLVHPVQLLSLTSPAHSLPPPSPPYSTHDTSLLCLVGQTLKLRDGWMRTTTRAPLEVPT